MSGASAHDLLSDVAAQIAACLDLTAVEPGRRLVITTAADRADGVRPAVGDHRHLVALPTVVGRPSVEWATLPFDAGSFDTVIVSGVFERVSDRGRRVLAAELARVCAGSVLVVAPLAPPFTPPSRVWSPHRTGLAPMLRWRVAGTPPVEIRLCGAVAASSRSDRDVPGWTVVHDRTHAVAVFDVGTRAERWSWRWYGRRSRRSVGRADLRNALQQATPPGRDRHWVRWRLDDGAAGVDGVSAPSGRAGRVVVDLPVDVPISAVEVAFRRTGAQGSQSPTVIAMSGGGPIDWRAAEAPPDHDGADVVRYQPVGSVAPALAAVTVVVPEGVTIRSIDCVSPGGDVTDLGVEVRPGPNLTVLVEGPVRLSWHLHSDRTGWLPTGGGAQPWGGVVRPIDLWPAGSTAPFPPTELQPYPWDLVHMFQTRGGFDLPAPWERVAEVSRGADHARPRRRVLLVAHMFPVPYNPVSGAFVFESAKAIVDRGDVAVRVVCPVPFWGPGRRRWRAWRAAQAAYAVALAQARQHVYRLDGVEVQYVPYYVPKDWHRHADAVATAVDALRPEIEGFGPDLVHAHSGYLDGHAASRIASALRVPLVITEHTGPLQRLFDDSRIAGKIVAAYRAATVVLGVSSFQAGEIRRLAPGVSPKVAVQFNGYDATAYSPGEPTLHLAPTLIYVGYITPGKGLDVLVSAFAELAHRLPGARLLVAGDVVDQPTMTAMLDVVRSHRIEHLIEFVGGCTRAQVADLMRSADALVLPSEGETFGCVLVEALGSGRMVVATACGGPEDIARDEPAVRLVPVGDPIAFAAAIEALWRTRLDPALDPESIATRAAARFDYRTVADQLVERYDSIVAAAGPRPEGTP